MVVALHLIINAEFDAMGSEINLYFIIISLSNLYLSGRALVMWVYTPVAICTGPAPSA